MTLREGLSIGARRRLFVGGCDTVELANLYGTPLYVMDEASIAKTAARSFARWRNTRPRAASITPAKPYA